MQIEYRKFNLQNLGGAGQQRSGSPRAIVGARPRGSDWLYTDVRGDDGVLELTAIGCELRLGEIYRRVRLPGLIGLR